MKFTAKRIRSRVFPTAVVFDLMPVQDGARLRTCRGDHMTDADGRERLWPALWDTGAPVTVIPHAFVAALGLPAINQTRPLEGFDGHCARHGYFAVLVGLPELPLLEARAIAPLDPDPHRPRRHITVGRDLLMRLVLKQSSNLPWEDAALPSDATEWVWRYRRAFPKGLADLLK